MILRREVVARPSTLPLAHGGLWDLPVTSWSGLARVEPVEAVRGDRAQQVPGSVALEERVRVAEQATVVREEPDPEGGQQSTHRPVPPAVVPPAAAAQGELDAGRRHEQRGEEG